MIYQIHQMDAEKRGIAIGEKRGIAIGEKQGITIGAKQEKLDNAKGMLHESIRRPDFPRHGALHR